MFILQTLPPIAGLRSGSVFNLKAEVLLRMGGFAYERVDGRPDKAPKGKMPVMRDGQRVIPDSAHIQSYLEREYGAAWDAGLNALQLAEARAYRTLVEERLYFVMQYLRWFECAEPFRETAFHQVPSPIRSFVFRMLQRKVRAQLHGQGVGRHSPQEIVEFGLDDLRALETRLTGCRFFFEAGLSSIDATIYGTLHALVRGSLSHPLRDFVEQSETLIAYEARVDDAVFGATSAEEDMAAAE